MYELSFVLRKNAPKKNGAVPVNIWLKIDNLRHQIYGINVSVCEKDWDEKNKVVKTTDPFFLTKNERIKEAYSEASKVLVLLELKGKVTYKNFKQDFDTTDKKNIAERHIDEIKPEEKPKTCFHKFAAEFVDLHKAKWSDGHQKNVNSVLTKVKDFQETLCLEDLNLEFWQRYEKYLREEKENISNTIHKNFKYLKPILRLAVKRKIISDNDLEDYSIKKNPTNREFLTFEELGELESLLGTYAPNTKHYNVLSNFLFMCYTGLRYSDLYSLRWENVVNNHLDLIMEKTEERQIIPLCDSAKNILPQRGMPLMKVFKVISNQKMNDYLKGIAIAAKINKTVSCHVARHTFATISLSIGIPIEVVSKLLGHSDIQTTQIYAKIIDKSKFDAMEKWNNYPKPIASNDNKEVVDDAIEHCPMDSDSFDGFQEENEKIILSHLSKEQLNEFEKLELPIRLEKAHGLFLFSCYTGFDYDLMSSLQKIHYDDSTGNLIFTYNEKEILFLLIPEAKKIIEKIIRQSQDKSLFDIPSRMTINMDLREIEIIHNLQKIHVLGSAKRTFYATVFGNYDYPPDTYRLLIDKMKRHFLRNMEIKVRLD